MKNKAVQAMGMAVSPWRWRARVHAGVPDCWEGPLRQPIFPTSPIYSSRSLGTLKSRLLTVATKRGGEAVGSVL